MSWFGELYPDIPPDFPPTLQIRIGVTYRVTFLENAPRLVTGGHRRRTAVINVEYKDKPRSLYVGSNVDLARQVRKIELEHETLEGLTVDITKIKKKGRSWIYKVEVIEE